MKFPTLKQMRVLREVAAYIETNSFPPSVRELAGAVGISATVTHAHLCALKQKGLVNWDPGLIRTLRLSDQGRASIGN